MLNINIGLSPLDMLSSLEKMWRLSESKIQATAQSWDPADGAPVFTVEGRWATRGWTEWTQGFQFGSSLLQYDATGEEEFLAESLEPFRDRLAASYSELCNPLETGTGP